MGFVNIRFEGICTQIKLPQSIAGGDRHVYHRAVLVHGEQGPEICGHKIPPHYAFLAIDQLYIAKVSPTIRDLPCLKAQKDGNWAMNGAKLRVENAVAGGPTYCPSSYIYSLTTLTPKFGELSPDAVFGTNAACHFDVGSGVFEGVETPRHSWFTLLRIETTGDRPVLLVEDMNGAGSGTIELESEAMVVVTNTGGKQLGDSRFDFLLHYCTAAVLPDDPQVPPDPADQPGNEGLGPGCSNSSYP